MELGRTIFIRFASIFICRKRRSTHALVFLLKVVGLAWTEVQEIAWDHQQSQVRLKRRKNSGDDGDHPFVIFLVANSLELEANIKLRLKGLIARVRGPSRLPSSLYMGIFAGVTKPKPFQRKRASLTADPKEQLPPLDEMRAVALESYRGSGRPMPTENSARRALAIEHIYDGKCSFSVSTASGPGLEGYHSQSLLCFGEEAIAYYASYDSMLSDNRSLYMRYDEIESWEVLDSSAQPERCFVLVSAVHCVV